LGRSAEAQEPAEEELALRGVGGLGEGRGQRWDDFAERGYHGPHEGNLLPEVWLENQPSQHGLMITIVMVVMPATMREYLATMIV
jgi:hypothetical protein